MGVIFSSESTESRRKTKMLSAELPLSLIESEILPRLPAKSVGRLMCVCKQWKSFLSTPMFARMHLHHVTINDYKLLQLYGLYPEFFYTDDGSTTIRCNRSPDPGGEDILASFDGLVCLASWGVPTKLAFWNPLTGAYKKLSNSGYPFPSFNTFAPFGFYKDSSNDYKLLYLGSDEWAYIYSNILDSWRKISFSFGSDTKSTSWSQVIFCGQCVYFTGLYFTETDMFVRSHPWIGCFDVDTEKVKKVQCPPIPGYAEDLCSRSLVVLNQRIHLCASYRINIDDIQADLWRMDGDGWVKVAAFPGAKHNLLRKPICIMSNGNWLAISEEKNSLGKMNTEDFTTSYWDFCSPDLAYRFSRTIYVETLVSPNP